MHRIMVVDDSPFIRAKYTKALTAGGFDVVEAKNGAEALEQFRMSEPDGVFLDLNMPVMDGVATLHELVHLDPAARVALITCAGSQSIILEPLRMEGRDRLDRPLDEALIVKIANRLISPGSCDMTTG